MFMMYPASRKIFRLLVVKTENSGRYRLVIVDDFLSATIMYVADKQWTEVRIVDVVDNFE